MNQQGYNKLILHKLSKIIKENPDLRFCQILVNLGIIELRYFEDKLLAIDPYFEESEVTYKKIVENNFSSLC